MTNAAAQATKQHTSSYTTEALTRHHRQIEEKYKDTDPEGVVLDPGTAELIGFNGYYSLSGGAAGAFFTVDTNMHIKNGASTPIYDVSLIISLDGQTSALFSFTGSFSNGKLYQTTAEGLAIDLTFTREDGQTGYTASLAGSITLPGKSKVTVVGQTYNNPIHYPVYKGTYSETVPLYLKQADGSYKQEKVALPVMEITDDYQLAFDYGSNNGNLQPVPTYTYNLNMYFFSFTKGATSYSLIMGTACAGGLACNSIIDDGAAPKSRSLQTIPFPNMGSKGIPNLASNELAQYSGYYLLPSIAPNAFLCIQAEYVPIIGNLDAYCVMVAVSLDGVTSQGYYFIEGGHMTFSNGTLSMPDQGINITFNRKYDGTNYALVSCSGSLSGHNSVTGYTPFNPVPLTGFGGATMKNTNGDSLSIQSNAQVTYNGTDMTNFLYVPIMYILANEWDAPTTVMSFGTNGGQGNTCIVTDYSNPSDPVISVVHACTPAQQNPEFSSKKAAE